MAELHELIEKIENPELRAQIAEAAKRALKQKKFGLVFEEHLPECTPLYDIPVRKGAKVSVRNGKANETYTVLKIEDGVATCLPKNSKEAVQLAVADLVTTAELGDPIYPCLQPLGEVCNAPDSELWHTLIEADNYHALQLLEYLYAGKVDCIYIDPPYNTRDKDWKYNNDYVDTSDEYKHSKWLSMMQKRLKLAEKLLNPDDAVLIVTIDEKEYLHLGCLLEEMFPEARMQMVSISNNLAGVQRTTEFARNDEFAFFVMFGDSVPQRMVLGSEWINAKSGGRTHLGSIRWDLLRRTGSNTQRTHSPGCYYPIYISDDGKRFCGTGEPLPLQYKKEDAPPAPEGTVALWPTRQDGSEGVWQLGPEKFNERVQKGLIKLGPFKGDHTCVYYLKPAEEAKLYDGTYSIIGYNEDGSVITSEAEQIERNVLPSTQWQISAHDATHYGTRLIKKFIPGRDFAYPKSLYAVRDCIRFFVANKPNALIVDFFAGSGTTLHAVNLLNAEDDGHRRCIMVTNNEVSNEEAKTLTAKGFRPGDDEWNALGIARHVTWPRTVCSITGRDINGNIINGDYGVQIEDYQYTYEQHYANVDPVLVVQVRQGSGGALSDTNLDDVLAKIEEKVGTPFKTGEVVHCFGEGTTVELNGLHIPHVKASEIADDHKIKVVFFKEALSTGWDCPRAETMMSFAVRNDPTYIAQLLGRMVRTPLQMRVMRDEFLNDVKLYLPHFNKDTVKKVVEELQASEGGDIPTEINGESLEEPTYITWTVHTPRRARQVEPDLGQISLFDNIGRTPAAVAPASVSPVPGNESPQVVPKLSSGDNCAPEYIAPRTVTIPVPSSGEQAALVVQKEEIPQGKQLELMPELDRVEIIDFINAKGYLTYFVRQDRINDYLKSLLDLATLLTHNVIYQGARDEVIDDVVGLIRAYIEELHRTGRYDALADQVLQFKLSVQVFDPFGKALQENYFNDFTLMSETDLDRQVRNADAKLGRYGFPNIYGSRYFDDENPNAHKIDCILFAADELCRTRLGEYAKNKLREFSGKYRVAVANRSDACKKKYREIMADSAVVSEQLFAIPENISVREDPDGIEYENHLLAAPDTGIAKIKLNGWEAALIEEESKRTDFVCWLRNPSRAAWALCLPYDIGGEKKSFYPDFLIIRSDPVVDYVIDILEPHGNQYADNLPKAKALAEYAKAEDRIGRIQLIHKTTDAGGNNKFVRLDLTDIAVRDKVLHALSNEELDHIFDADGSFS